MKNLIAFIGAALFSTYALAAGPSLTDLQDSVVRLDLPDGGTCSGWVLKGSNKVMTAAHCFETADPKVKATKATVTFNDAHTAKYHIVKMGKADSVLRDYAVLAPDGEAGRIPEGLSVCTNEPVYGQPIVAMGYPLGVDRVMFFGQVANPVYHATEEFSKDLEGTVVFSSQMYPGNSGGPIIDITTGCVVAQAELLVQPAAGIGSGIAVGIPISEEEVSL